MAPVPLVAVMLDFAMSSPDPINNPAPWFYDEWIDITGRDHPPWADVSTPQSAGMTPDNHAAVKAYVRRYVAITDARDRLEFSLSGSPEGRTPYDETGRLALAEWFTGQWRLWDVNTIFDECMVRAKRDVYFLAANSETGNTVRFLDSHQHVHLPRF